MTRARHDLGLPDGVGASWEGALVALATGITSLAPDDLPDLVRDCAGLAGGSDLRILLVDMEQQLLRPFPAGDPPVPVDGPDPGPGNAFRTETTVSTPIGDGGSVRLWLPLMDSAERLGVLEVAVAVAVDGDGDGIDRNRWEAFASMVGEAMVSKSAYGDAIIRARRTRPMVLAAELRWTILPPLTFTSDQVEISGILEPAYEIAGDTFDYAVTDGLLHLAVLDAMGHGLEATQIANLAVGEYRRARRADAPLGEMLRSIDEIVAAEFGESRFVTGQLATLDLRTGRLTLVNAGHPRPLRFRDGRAAGTLDCTPCPPMGLGLVRTEESISVLEPGEAVLFHTDGISEARSSATVDFGEDGLRASVEESFALGHRPAEVLRRLMHAVSDHVGGPLRDDASAVLLRRP